MCSLSSGRILGRNWDKSLKVFPACYSQSPLLTGFTQPHWAKVVWNWFVMKTKSSSVRTRGSQWDVVYLGWPIAPSYMSPNAEGGESCGVSANEYSCTQEPIYKLWRSNSIFNLWRELSRLCPETSVKLYVHDLGFRLRFCNSKRHTTDRHEKTALYTIKNEYWIWRGNIRRDRHLLLPSSRYRFAPIHFAWVKKKSCRDPSSSLPGQACNSK